MRKIALLFAALWLVAPSVPADAAALGWAEVGAGFLQADDVPPASAEDGPTAEMVGAAAQASWAFEGDEAGFLLAAMTMPAAVRPADIPEPQSVLYFGLGLAALGILALRGKPSPQA